MSRILVVEDEERITSFLVRGLRAAGHTTTVTGDGRSALQHVSRRGLRPGPA